MGLASDAFPVDYKHDFDHSDGGDTACERDGTYYFQNVVFMVEGCLFKVPVHSFKRGSPEMRAMITSALGAEGEPTNTITLDGITKVDFKTLLTVMYPLEVKPRPMSLAEWTSVLRLSTLWQLAEIRALAIEKVSTFDVEPTDKIVLSQEFGVADWYEPACEELSTRPATLTMNEAKKIGLETAVHVFHARERSPHCGCSAISTKSDVAKDNLAATSSTSFQLSCTDNLTKRELQKVTMAATVAAGDVVAAIAAVKANMNTYDTKRDKDEAATLKQAVEKATTEWLVATEAQAQIAKVLHEKSNPEAESAQLAHVEGDRFVTNNAKCCAGEDTDGPAKEETHRLARHLFSEVNYLTGEGIDELTKESFDGGVKDEASPVKNTVNSLALASVELGSHSQDAVSLVSLGEERTAPISASGAIGKAAWESKVDDRAAPASIDNAQPALPQNEVFEVATARKAEREAAALALKVAEDAAGLILTRKNGAVTALEVANRKLAAAAAIVSKAEGVVKQADAEIDAVKKAMMGPARRQAMKDIRDSSWHLRWAEGDQQAAKVEIQALSEEAAQVEGARQAARERLLEFTATPSVLTQGGPQPQMQYEPSGSDTTSASQSPDNDAIVVHAKEVQYIATKQKAAAASEEATNQDTVDTSKPWAVWGELTSQDAVLVDKPWALSEEPAGQDAVLVEKPAAAPEEAVGQDSVVVDPPAAGSEEPAGQDAVLAEKPTAEEPVGQDAVLVERPPGTPPRSVKIPDAPKNDAATPSALPPAMPADGVADMSKKAKMMAKKRRLAELKGQSHSRANTQCQDLGGPV